MTKTKALALLSGGLDSTLATELVARQNIDVVAINFRSPFCLCKKGGCGAIESANQLGVPLKVVNIGDKYLKIVRKPKYGYGKNMNPCIDCRILILREARKYAKEIGASFIFTGEVLNERPMSQHFKAMKIIEEEAGLKGKLLRPLSARLLPETIAEKEGLVDRKKLLSIQGRSRKPQIKLAEDFNIKDYPCPAGGCLLTYKEYANKLRDLLKHKSRVSMADVALLKVGRHFRYDKNKIIVGRNELENKLLANKRARNDFILEALNIEGPITLLQGKKTEKAIKVAAELTAFYSDAKNCAVEVGFGREILNRSILVSIPSQTEVEKFRIGK